jgi:hypothetical protein
MNNHDPLEAELAALRPVDASPQLRESIANRLAQDAPELLPTHRNRVWWSGALTGGVVAAGLLLGFFLSRATPNKAFRPQSPSSPPELSAAAFDPALPSVWNYEKALARSPHDLELLLDQHAAASSAKSAIAPRSLFIQSNVNLLFEGEL